MKCISGGIQLDLADDWEFMANDGDGTGYYCVCVHAGVIVVWKGISIKQRQGRQGRKELL